MNIYNTNLIMTELLKIRMGPEITHKYKIMFDRLAMWVFNPTIHCLELYELDWMGPGYLSKTRGSMG